MGGSEMIEDKTTSKFGQDSYTASRHWKLRINIDRAMLFITAACFILVLIPLFSILFQVFYNGLRAFKLIVLLNEGGSPVSTMSGIRHAITGTIYATLIGSAIGIPAGIVVGTYLAEFGNNSFADALRVVINTMVSIPTIITGVVVWAFIVTRVGHFSVLAGGIALGLIMIPLVARTTEEMILLVSPIYVEAGYALGLTRMRNTISIVLANASKGIASGVLLAVARIMGETAPLLFTAFFSQASPSDILDPAATLPVLIYNYAISPFEYWQGLAWVAAMVLILLNLDILFITRLMFPETHQSD